MRPFPILAGLLALGALAVAATAQQPELATYDNAGDARAACRGPPRRLPPANAEALEAEAAKAGQQADRTARAEAAAAAALRIQEAQATIAAREADIRLIDQSREELRARLAQRQLPVVRLTGALQRLSRRPLTLSLLRPGSLQDTVHMRAMLDTMLPEVQRRTAALRGEIAKGKALRDQALAVQTPNRTGENLAAAASRSPRWNAPAARPARRPAAPPTGGPNARSRWRGGDRWPDRPAWRGW
jgi:hypothetical protein